MAVEVEGTTAVRDRTNAAATDFPNPNESSRGRSGDGVKLGGSRSSLKLVLAVLAAGVALALGLGALYGPGLVKRYQTRSARLAAFEVADARLNSANYNDALDPLAEFLKTHPSDFRGVEKVVAILQTHRDKLTRAKRQEADRLIREGLRYHSAQVPWRVLLVDNAMETRDFDIALDQALAISEINGVRVEVLERIAEQFKEIPEGGIRTVKRLVFAERAAKKDLRNPLFLKEGARASLLLGRREQAEAKLKQLTPDQGPEKNGEAAYLMGICRALTKNTEEAQRLLAQAYRLQPDLIEAYAAHAALLRGQMSDEAFHSPIERRPLEEVLERVIRANPGQAQAYLVRASFGVDAAQIAADLRKAAQLAPNDPEVVFALAALLQREGRTEEAIERVRPVFDAQPDHPVLSRALTGLLLSRGDTDEAVAVFRRHLDAAPDLVEDRLAMGELLLGLERLDEVRTLLEQWPESKLLAARKSFLQAQLLVAERKFGEAIDLLETQVLPELSNDKPVAMRAAQLLASCHEALGHPEDQLKALRQAIALNPEADSARAQLGLALLRRGQFEDAQRQFNTLVGRRDDALVTIASLHLIKTLRQPPEIRDWSVVERSLAEARAADPDSPRPRFIQAQMWVARDELDQAERELTQLRQKFPEFPDAWPLSIALARGRNNLSQVRALLVEAGNALSDPEVRARTLIAGWLAARLPESSDELEKLARSLMDAEAATATVSRTKLTETTPFKPISGEALARLVDAVAVLSGDERALTVFETLRQRRPDDVALWLAALPLALRNSDLKLLERFRDVVRVGEGQTGVWWRLAEVSRLLIEARQRKTTDLSTVPDLLSQLDRERPDWTILPLLKAEYADLRGNEPEVIQALQAALKLEPTNFAIARRLVERLQRRQRWNELDEAIRLVETQAGLPSDLLQAALDLALRRNDAKRATELTQRLNRAQTTAQAKPEDRLRLARALAMAGRDQDARDALKEVIDQVQAHPARAAEAWLVLVELAQRRGEAAEAERILEEAVMRLPEAERPLFRARGLALMGRGDEATAAYDHILETRAAQAKANSHAEAPLADLLLIRLEKARVQVSLKRFDQAEADLRTLLGEASSRPANQDRGRLVAELIPEIRRSLAEVLALSERPRTLALIDEAASLLEQNLQVRDVLEDRRMLGLVLTQIPARQAQAKELLDQVAAVDQLRPNEQYALIVLREARCDWPQARPLIREMVAARQASPAQMHFFIDMALMRQDLDLATEVLEGLRAVAPKGDAKAQRSIKVAAARLEHARGATEQARKMVADLVRVDQLDPVATANLLKELGDFVAAEAVLRQTLATTPQPQARIPLRVSLARLAALQRRHAETLTAARELLEERDCPPRVVGELLASWALQAQPPAEFRSQALAWIESLPDRIDPVPFLTPAALLLDAEGRHAEAIAKYRLLLRSEPQNFPALNNLAYLLALTETDLDEALELINRALVLNQRISSVLDTRAVVLLARRQTSEAIRDLLKVLEDRPSKFALFHLALAYDQERKTDTARDFLDRALAAGLTAEDLHPLERPKLARLLRGDEEDDQNQDGRTSSTSPADPNAR